LADIAAIRVYVLQGLRSFGYGELFRPIRRVEIRGKDGRSIVLSNLNFLALGAFEDRTAAYLPFLRALVERTANCAPGARLISGMPPTIWWCWTIVFGAMTLGLAATVVFSAIGLLIEKQMSWGTAGFLPLLAAIAIGPASFLRALWPQRSRPLNANEI
jgi:hypothetical protein